MSRYLVTTGTNYQPFSYDEIVKPLESMAAAQNEAADAYDVIDMQTQALANYISDAEPEVKATYNAYIQKLGALQDQLWENGYDATTRGNLSAARRGYARDITAIDAAIKRRQELSKAFRDAAVKDPTLIQGRDPSRDSLDKFFRNDTYGTDWYSYSGKQFQDEVSKDAQNRANEMLRYYIDNDLKAPGYLFEFQKKGYTSKNVNDAVDIVSRVVAGNEDINDVLKEYNNSPGSQILGQVLYDHMKSAGMLDAGLDDVGLSRSLYYGAAGLSSSIGEETMKELNDYEWTYLNDPSKNGSKSGGGSGSKQKNPPGNYDLNTPLVERGSTEETAKLASRLAKSEYGAYSNGEKHIILSPQGEGEEPAMQTFDNPISATEFVYHTPERDEILKNQKFDIALDLNDKNELKERTVVVRSSDGSTRSVKRRIQRISAAERNALLNAARSEEEKALINSIDCAIEQYVPNEDGKHGEWKLVRGDTLSFGKARQDYNGHVKNLESLNKEKNVDISKFAMTPAREKEYRSKYNIDDAISWRDIYHIMNLQSGAMMAEDAVISNDETAWDLGRVRSKIKEVYAAGGPNGETSRLAAKPLYADGRVGSPGKLEDFLSFDQKSGKIDFDDIISVTASPQNLIDGEVVLTLAPRVGGKPSKVIVSLDYLGSDRADNLRGTDGSFTDRIRVLMSPISDPQGTLLREDSSYNGPNLWYSTMIRSFDNDDFIRRGLVNRDYKLVDPSTIVRNPQLAANLYNLIKDLINGKAGSYRDEQAQNHYQHTGDSNENPSTYMQVDYPQQPTN